MGQVCNIKCLPLQHVCISVYLYRCALSVVFACIGMYAYDRLCMGGYLCSRCVFDSVGVVVVVDDVVVQNSGAFLGR